MENESFEEYLERNNSMTLHFLKSEKANKFAKRSCVAAAVSLALFFAVVGFVMADATFLRAVLEVYPRLATWLITLVVISPMLPLLGWVLALLTLGIVDVINAIKRIIKLKKEKEKQ